MITSVRNPKVQEIRTLQNRAKERREAGAFVVEGVRLAEEALQSGWGIHQALYTKGLSERGLQLVETLIKRDIPGEEISESVMKAASDTKSPQGILLSVELRQLPLPDHLDLVLILDGLGDPGNLGTLLRSAAAAGVDAVLLGPGCADAFAPKVLRSGMGAHFHLPIRNLNWVEIAKVCQSRGLHLFLAEAGQGLVFDQADLTRPLAFIIGGEAHGVGQAAKDLHAVPIQIPMPGKMESLNAATAGSLLLFETLRQRRTKKGTM